MVSKVMLRLLSLCVWLPAICLTATAQDAPPAGGTDITGEFFRIDTDYAARAEAAVKPMEDLQEKFRAALQRYQEEARRAGNLDGVMAAKKMLEELEDGEGGLSSPTDPGAGKLAETYAGATAGLKPGIADALREAKRLRVQALDKLADTLRKEGQLDRALVAHAESKRVALSPDDSMVESSSPLYAGKGIILKPSATDFRTPAKEKQPKAGYWIGEGKTFLDLTFQPDPLVLKKADKAVFIFRVGRPHHSGTQAPIEISCGGRVLGSQTGIKRGAVGRIPLDIAALRAAGNQKLTVTVGGDKLMIPRLEGGPEVVLVLE